MRIVFMGTPDFASASLQALLEKKLDVVGVFTQPDKPVGRKQELTFSPVKKLALDNSIPVFQPISFKSGEAQQLLEQLHPDLLVVVAYGKILPKECLTIAPLGAINVHGSLLPKYRGAAPIQWAVLNGDSVTGVSTMYLSERMDSGDVIFTKETEIGMFETSGELFERLKVMGADLLIDTIAAIAEGSAPRAPQDEEKASYVAKLDRSLCPIDWARSSVAILHQIYGLQPWPVASTQLWGKEFKVFGAAPGGKTSLPAGEIVCFTDLGLEIACGDGFTLLITDIQENGRKRMSAADYLNGHNSLRQERKN